MQRSARSILLRRLQGLAAGQIVLVDADGIHAAGVPGEASCRLQVHDPRFYVSILGAGTLGAAEAYLRNDWDTDDLLPLFRLLAQNQAAMQHVQSSARLFRLPLDWLWHRLTRNSISGSRSNIHAHYDLGNAFFELFLDETMTYSSGIFADAELSLADASRAKYDRICRRLELRPGMRVMEIGAGWGGFALHAAQNYGCHVTATTISREQFHYAQDRIAAAGLQDLIELQCNDYRQLTGEYDRVVSIEMIEAVGHRYLRTYFQACAALLRPRGELMLQAITIPDQRYAKYLRSVDFIQRYIFPGGALPSVGAMTEAASTTDLQLLQLEDFTPHYARTLACWRERFWKNIDQVRDLVTEERFVRMWDYYLAYCEAGFRERMTSLLQLHYRKV